MSKRFLLAAALLSAAACKRTSSPVLAATPAATPAAVTRNAEPGESRLRNIRQLTFGGENAEAYWSGDGKWITFQSTRDGRTCDQQFVMRADGSDMKRISDGRGKTTCGWFLPGSERLFFSSSTAHDDACPVRPDPSKGYVWPLDRYDLYTVGRDGTGQKRLTSYDVYTGGPWWSPDGKRIVYRANHPKDSAEVRQYKELLGQSLVRPSRVELFVMNADGSDQRQVTALGGANFGPSWSPDGTRIIFSSNFVAPRSGNFELYLVKASESMATGDKLERITTSEVFDGFAMFSPNGKQLMWASNRHARTTGETNVFVADFDWK